MPETTPAAARYLSALETTLAVARAHVTDLEAECTKARTSRSVPESLGWDAEPSWMRHYLHHLRRSSSPQVVTVSRAAALLVHALLVATMATGQSIRGAHARQLRVLIAYLDEILGIGWSPDDHAWRLPTSEERLTTVVTKRQPYGRAKLTVEQVLAIRAQGRAGRPVRDIAGEAQITSANVRMILNRETWRHLP